MTSTSVTGGRGVHYESRVGAFYLTAVLSDQSVLGLADQYRAREARFQQKERGDPLDDLIVLASNGAGAAKLSLQIKSKFTVGVGQLFRDIMADCWATFKNAGFQPGCDHFGVAGHDIAQTWTRAAENVASKARNVSSAGEFLAAIASLSSKARDFVRHVRAALDAAANRSISDTELWDFLIHFVLLRLDLLHDGPSQTLSLAYTRIESSLNPKDHDRMEDLWNALIGIADHAKAAGGSLDRPRLVEQLIGRFRLTSLPRFEPDLARIVQTSRHALQDIRNDICGFHLARAEITQQASEQTTTGGFVEIIGEPGIGKSAILQAVAEQKMVSGPVFVLSHKRACSGAGWEGLAQALSLQHGCDEIVRELSCHPAPSLFIDGIDRIEEDGFLLAIFDLFKAIHRSPHRARWSIVVTTRTVAANDFRDRIPAEAVDGFERRQVIVPQLSTAERQDVAKKHPRIRALMLSGGPPSTLAARPFLVDRLLRTSGLVSRGAIDQITEVDLMVNILTDDSSHGAAMRERRLDVLEKISRRRLEAGERWVKSGGFDHEAVQTLVTDQILDHDLISRELRFAHDILEDWSLCWYMNQQGDRLCDAIRNAGQPLWLLDSIRLLSAWRLETDTTGDHWLELIGSLSSEGLEPRWRRAALTGIVYSTRGLQLLNAITEKLVDPESTILRDLLVALRTVELEPASPYLPPDLAAAFDEIDQSIEKNFSVPRVTSWLPMLVWLLTHLDKLPTRVCTHMIS